MKRSARPRDLTPWLAKPVIPVVWKILPDEATLAHASLVFLHCSQLAELNEDIAWLKRGPLARTPIVLHIDLLEGLTSDEAGLRFLAGLRIIDGIITVRQHLIAPARRLGLASILLLFLQDGLAVERGRHLVEQCQPDALELVPGVAALETAAEFENVPMPRIAGGLVRTPELVHKLLHSGCKAVSSSSAKLWLLNQRG